VGLISDTHGLLRPEAVAAFANVDVILHAGDVGGRGILTQLSALAPVHAVYGNNDPPGEPGLASHVEMLLEGYSIHLSHGHELGRPTPERLLAKYRADIVVFGHTHQPLIERAGRRQVVNPGAAGPRRFDVKPSVALMSLGGGKVVIQLIWL
jgi:putative phosphoesterase